MIRTFLTNASGPRMSFAEAAQFYGMKELRRRHPDASNATLREVLAWPLEVLTDLLERLSPTAVPVAGKV
jgi:hypothetical protein